METHSRHVELKIVAIEEEWNGIVAALRRDNGWDLTLLTSKVDGSVQEVHWFDDWRIRAGVLIPEPACKRHDG